MPEEPLKDRIDRIKVKVSMLLLRYETERKQRLAAEERVRALEEELARQQQANSRLSRDLETVKMASVLTPDHRDVEQTRAFLSGLVREIDKCITYLTH